MAIGCGGQIIKILLVIFNLIVFLAGLGLVVIGCWFLADDEVVDYIGVASDHGTKHIIWAAAVIILVVGVFSVVIGLIGCWGAFREKTSCLNIYAVIIVLIILLEIVGAILAGVFHYKIMNGLEQSMNKSVQNDYGKVDAETKSWDLMQYKLSCCGVKGPSDWKNSSWKSNHTNVPVPKTCCVLKNGNLSDPQPKNETACYNEARRNSTSQEYLHHKGCEASLVSWINNQIAVIIGIAVGVIIIEVAVVLLACVLRSRIRSGYEYV